MKEHYVNELDNFIGGWYLEDTSICDDLITFHKNFPNKKDGEVGHQVRKDVKNSVDVYLSGDRQLGEKYIAQLQLAVNKYIEKYKFCNYYSGWTIQEDINIQHYPLGGGFYNWHTERANGKTWGYDRHLVFMTYLNDVTDGGETEFYHQKLKIKPEKGLTLIWGTDWTFTHRGVPSHTQEKYIATGWFSYIQ